MIDLYILGASGSIGRQTIDIVRRFPKRFRIVALALGHDLKLAQELVDLVQPKLVCLRKKTDYVKTNAQVCYGDEGLLFLASYKASQNKAILINALVGSSGLKPTIAGIKSGKDIALANKETLVMAGDIIVSLVSKYKVKLHPIDSEHSAIWQCLRGEKKSDIKRLIITASGGAFRDKKREELTNVTLNEALAHPNWSMGKKITIDSATMMNKGFEVIEAHHLFALPYDNITTILHKESIIHSLVEFKDNTIKAVLGSKDMRLPILYALSYPSHLVLKDLASLTLEGLDLSFRPLSQERFPLLALAYLCGKKGGLYPTVLNAANEGAVSLFLAGKIEFLAIEEIVFDYVKKDYSSWDYNIDNIIKLDKIIQEEIIEKYGE